jgi:hypothetical protein
LNFLEVNNNGYVSPCSRNKAFYIIDGWANIGDPISTSKLKNIYELKKIYYCYRNT